MVHECWQKEIARKVRKMENPKGNPNARGSNKGKPSKTGLSGLEYPKSETSSETQESAQMYHTDNSHTDNSWCEDVWSYDEWMMTGVRLDGIKVGTNLMTIPQAHFHLENVVLCAMSSPKRSEWAIMNLDTGAARVLIN